MRSDFAAWKLDAIDCWPVSTLSPHLP